MYGPGFQNWNLSVFKNFKIQERVNIQFRADGYNFVNHPNWGGSTGGGLDRNPNNGTFGQVTAKGGERNMQFGLAHRLLTETNRQRTTTAALLGRPSSFQSVDLERTKASAAGLSSSGKTVPGPQRVAEQNSERENTVGVELNPKLPRGPFVKAMHLG